MKTVRLSTKPKEGEVIYLEDIEKHDCRDYCYVLVANDQFVLLLNSEGWFQWLDVINLEILTEPYKFVGDAIKDISDQLVFEEFSCNIHIDIPLKYYDKNEFNLLMMDKCL